MLSTNFAPSSQDSELIYCLLQDVNCYLDRQQRFDLLWVDVDNHIRASHFAESVQDRALVALHLNTVMRLLEEIYTEYPQNRENLSYWFRQMVN
jgi:hypothetical protein